MHKCDLPILMYARYISDDALTNESFVLSVYRTDESLSEWHS